MIQCIECYNNRPNIVIRLFELAHRGVGDLSLDVVMGFSERFFRRKAISLMNHSRQTDDNLISSYMATLPGYEYDIFVSYRHNDNRSGWVTEFVDALKVELAATIKEPISVYFDTNLHDGLLQTYDVDKSLEGKLKCLIFIPIISHTYCDPKSFAWNNEFVVFCKLAKADAIGLDVRLSNRNVTTRILPVQIHDIDAKDQALFEKESGRHIRADRFYFQIAGS